MLRLNYVVLNGLMFILSVILILFSIIVGITHVLSCVNIC